VKVLRTSEAGRAGTIVAHSVRRSRRFRAHIHLGRDEPEAEVIPTLEETRDGFVPSPSWQGLSSWQNHEDTSSIAPIFRNVGASFPPEKRKATIRRWWIAGQNRGQKKAITGARSRGVAACAEQKPGIVTDPGHDQVVYLDENKWLARIKFTSDDCAKSTAVGLENSQCRVIVIRNACADACR